MPQEVDFESDALGKLLTDALRAGPGSPQWHEATLRLSDDTSAQAQEYKRLLEARGLRTANAPTGPATSTTQRATGGITWSQPMPPQSAFAIEATLRAPRLSDDLVPEIVLAEQPLDRENPTASRELVWLLRDGRS